MKGSTSGMTLIEVLISVGLLAIGTLAVAPMFIRAAQGNASGADMGIVGAMAVERMESLRSVDYDSLDIGGSLTGNVTGFFDDSTAGFLVRWQVTDNSGAINNTKVVTVRALSQRDMVGPRREVTVTTLRGD